MIEFLPILTDSLLESMDRVWKSNIILAQKPIQEQVASFYRDRRTA